MENEEKNEEIKTVRLTNPLALGMIGPFIKSFVEKMDVPTITYETLYTYFVDSIQRGGDVTEFWVVLKGEEPIAFAHWLVKGVPHVGVVYADFIYSWNRMAGPVDALIETLLDFAKRHRCRWITGDAINEVVYKIFEKYAKKNGFEMIRSNRIHWMGKK